MPEVEVITARNALSNRKRGNFKICQNTFDTLKYVRMLKEKNIAVYFEDEKINR